MAGKGSNGMDDGLAKSDIKEKRLASCSSVLLTSISRVAVGCLFQVSKIPLGVVGLIHIQRSSLFARLPVEIGICGNRSEKFLPAGVQLLLPRILNMLSTNPNPRLEIVTVWGSS
jgi:hypothetical protein